MEIHNIGIDLGKTVFPSGHVRVAHHPPGANRKQLGGEFWSDPLNCWGRNLSEEVRK